MKKLWLKHQHGIFLVRIYIKDKYYKIINIYLCPQFHRPWLSVTYSSSLPRTILFTPKLNPYNNIMIGGGIVMWIGVFKVLHNACTVLKFNFCVCAISSVVYHVHNMFTLFTQCVHMECMIYSHFMHDMLNIHGIDFFI